MRNLVLATLVLTVTIVEAPFMLRLAGDAQVHLAVAESFVQGNPFRYNPGDPRVMASTSPFWTMLLIALFHVFGDWTPLALKVASALCWAGVSYLLWKVVADIWQWTPWKRAILLAIWLSNTALIVNALGGLENVLSAVQLLLVYLVCVRGVRSLSWQQSLGLGMLVGWAILTRLDGGFFSCVCVCSLFMIRLLTGARAERKTIVAQFLLVALVSALCILPWHAYQYSLTGHFVSDSAMARLYGGRRTSWPIVEGYLYFHPKALLTLITVFMPVTIGVLLMLHRWGRLVCRSGERVGMQLSETYAIVASVTILGVGILFYTFVVGADQFGRYFVPVFPFFFILGFQGLWTLYEELSDERRWLATCIVSGTVGFLLLGSGLDYYRRIVLRDQYESELMDVVRNHEDRTGYTDRYLARLGVPNARHIRLALMEVQLRFYVDDRIDIISLDGRTSPQLLKYVDRTNGMPAFREYFEETRPDFVHVGQWCGAGGWTSRVGLQRSLPTNLICEWQRLAQVMKIGESFDWNRNRVVLVSPGTVRIDWQQAAGLSAS